MESEVSPSGTVIKTYTFDKAGNRSKITVSGTKSYVTTYVYDANNRLLTETTVKEDKTEIGEYTYDPNGNQLSKLAGVVTVGDAPQGVPLTGLGIYELSEAYENGFIYELDEYDVFNRLIGVQKDGKTARYAYKANGLRLSKEVDGQKTTHIWDGGNIVLDVGVNNDRYIRGINLIKSDSNGFYIYNAHGDVVQLTDVIGTVTKDYHYDAFGVETNKDEADNNPFRYCAEYFDKETDTIYLRARYYSPRLGRFLTQDPIRDGLNWYTYANANPIRYCDPSGKSFIALGAIALGALLLSGCSSGSTPSPSPSAKPSPSPSPTPTPTPTPTPSPTPTLPDNRADYFEFLSALGLTEAEGKSYGYKDPNSGALGLYQFTTIALRDIGFKNEKGNWTELAKLYGVYSDHAFLNSPEVQDLAIVSFHQKLWDGLESHGALDYIGKEVNGVLVTESGLLAAAHLSGAKGTSDALKSGDIFGGSGDFYGTTPGHYIEKFGGYNVDYIK